MSPPHLLKNALLLIIPHARSLHTLHTVHTDAWSINYKYLINGTLFKQTKVTRYCERRPLTFKWRHCCAINSSGNVARFWPLRSAALLLNAAQNDYLLFASSFSPMFCALNMRIIGSICERFGLR